MTEFRAPQADGIHPRVRFPPLPNFREEAPSGGDRHRADDDHRNNAGKQHKNRDDVGRTRGLPQVDQVPGIGSGVDDVRIWGPM
jgi:hypothetical protein